MHLWRADSGTELGFPGRTAGPNERPIVSGCPRHRHDLRYPRADGSTATDEPVATEYARSRPRSRPGAAASLRIRLIHPVGGSLAGNNAIHALAVGLLRL